MEGWMVEREGGGYDYGKVFDDRRRLVHCTVRASAYQVLGVGNRRVE